MLLNLKINLRASALAYLGITESAAILAKKLADFKSRYAWALKFLGITEKDVEHIEDVRKVGGLTEWALQYLKIPNIAALKEFLTWSKMTKIQKIESLVTPAQNIRDFFNQVYVEFRRHKKQFKSKWKREDVKSHLQAIKTIVDRCIVLDDMTEKDLKLVVMHAYMAFYGAFIAGTQHKGVVKKMQVMPQRRLKAA